MRLIRLAADGGAGGQALAQDAFIHPQALGRGLAPQILLHRVGDGLEIRPQLFQDAHPAFDLQAMGGNQAFQQEGEPGLGRVPGVLKDLHPLAAGVVVRVLPGRQGQGPDRQTLLGKERKGPLHGLERRRRRRRRPGPLYRPGF